MNAVRLALAVRRQTIAWVLTLGASACLSQPARDVTATRAEGIVVDGLLDEPAWSEGTWHDDFRVFDAPDRPASVQTHFKVRFDDGHVYFGLSADEPAPEGLAPSEAGHDGKLWAGDSIELMVDPDPGSDGYFHYACNCRGAFYDAEVVGPDSVELSQWDGAAQVAARVAEGAWTMELGIPFSEWRYDPAAPTRWRLNITRNRRSAESEMSSYVPLAGSYHKPDQFAPLRLQGANLQPYLWAISEPSDVTTVSGPEGLRQSLSLQVTNMTGQFRFVGLEVSHGEGDPSRALGGLDAGQSAGIDVRGLAVEDGRALLRVRLYDRLHPDRTLARAAFPHLVDYTPLAVEVLQPHYRGNIYASEDLRRIVASAHVALPRERLEDCLIRGRLVSAESRQVVADVEAPAAPEVLLELPVPALAEGEYALEVALVPALEAEEALATASTAVRKLPEVEHEWRIRDDGVVLYNGEPFVAFGFFSVAPEWRNELRAAGHNATQWYSAQYRDDEQLLAYLDEVDQSGLKIMFYPYTQDSQWMKPAVQQPLTDGEAEAIRARVRAIRHHPAILGYYTFDEPGCWGGPVGRAESVYRICAEEDPYHPCVIVCQRASALAEYGDAADILMPDPYPGFLWRGGPARDIGLVGDRVDTALRVAGGRKAVWVTPQAFNWQLVSGRANHREPNFRELRNMVWQALIHGATGVVAYKCERWWPDVRLGMDFVAGEVRDLRDVVVARDRPKAVTVTAQQPEHFCASVRAVRDHLYLLACSTAKEPQRVEFAFPETRSQVLHVVSEERLIPVTDGVFSDRFQRYGVHLYTTDADAADRPTVAATQAEIDRLRAPKPGNLLHESAGTEIACSSRGTRLGRRKVGVLQAVVDGLTAESLPEAWPIPPGWTAEADEPLPQWLELRLRRPAALGRLVLHTLQVAECTVQVSEESGWRTVATAQPRDHVPDEICFEPARTEAIRITVTGQRGEGFLIYEVEGYER
ncbi:MAG: sugar-binding protein [Armatimonadota bacterium]